MSWPDRMTKTAICYRCWQEHDSDLRYCTECRTVASKRMKDINEKKRERYRTHAYSWGGRNLKQSQTHSQDPDETELRSRCRNYGIELEDYQNMLDLQNDRCAICETIPQTFHIDHCHKTGKVRGLLCRGCNHGLGQFKDDPIALERAAKYLRRNT